MLALLFFESVLLAIAVSVLNYSGATEILPEYAGLKGFLFSILAFSGLYVMYKFLIEGALITLGMLLFACLKSEMSIERRLFIVRLISSTLVFGYLVLAAIETSGLIEPFFTTALFWFPSIVLTYYIFRNKYKKALS